MGMKGGTGGGGSAVSSSLRGCLMPAIAGLVFGEVSLEERAEFGILRAAESEQCFTEVSPWPQWQGGQILDTA